MGVCTVFLVKVFLSPNSFTLVKILFLRSFFALLGEGRKNVIRRKWGIMGNNGVHGSCLWCQWYNCQMQWYILISNYSAQPGPKKILAQPLSISTLTAVFVKGIDNNHYCHCSNISHFVSAFSSREVWTKGTGKVLLQVGNKQSSIFIAHNITIVPVFRMPWQTQASIPGQNFYSWPEAVSVKRWLA